MTSIKDHPRILVGLAQSERHDSVKRAAKAEPGRELPSRAAWPRKS
jgi:hypothetical protein